MCSFFLDHLISTINPCSVLRQRSPCYKYTLSATQYMEILINLHICTCTDENVLICRSVASMYDSTQNPKEAISKPLSMVSRMSLIQAQWEDLIGIYDLFPIEHRAGNQNKSSGTIIALIVKKKKKKRHIIDNNLTVTHQLCLK